MAGVQAAEQLAGSSSHSNEEDNEHEDLCRICRCSAEPPNRKLFHPCKCSGSIKFVHQDCLLQWLSHSGRRHCEVLEASTPHPACCILSPRTLQLTEMVPSLLPLPMPTVQAAEPHCQHFFPSARLPDALLPRKVCKYEFSFTPVYSTDAPLVLSVNDVIEGLGEQMIMGIKFTCRVGCSHVLLCFVLNLTAETFLLRLPVLPNCMRKS